MEFNIATFIWPLTAIIIALIFFKPINLFIKNMTKVKALGIEAESSSRIGHRTEIKGDDSERLPTESNDQAQSKFNKDLSEGFDSKSLQEMGNIIIERLNLNQDTEHEEKIDRLLQ